jgi:hypothetical protein
LYLQKINIIAVTYSYKFPYFWVLFTAKKKKKFIKKYDLQKNCYY